MRGAWRRISSIGFAVALAAAFVLAGFAAWQTVRTILRPIQAMTHAALGISAGNLNQIVPYHSRDELGQLAEAFNTMTRHLRDVRQSQSARLLRAQQTTQATVDSFPDPVIVIDSEGYVEMANPAARRLLGVLPKQHGHPTSGTWQPPEPLRQPLADALQAQRDYSPDGFDRVILLGSNGRERAVLPRILSIRDPYGNTLGAAVVLQDVTRLRLLDQVKSNLVATASHELKTPLTSIRLAVHLLLEESVGPLTAKQTELLLDARENSERLLAMINNLLDLARLEQGSRQLDLAARAAGIAAADRGGRRSSPRGRPGGRARARHAARSAKSGRRRVAARKRAGQPARQRADLHRSRRPNHSRRPGRRRYGDAVGRRHGRGDSSRVASARV